MSKLRSSPAPEAVLFDLDDTLIDSFDARLHALESVFRDARIERPTAEQFLRGLDGRQLFGTLDRLPTGREIGRSLSDAYRDAYWTKGPGRISLYPGVRPLLETLHSQGTKLGVVTQKGREFKNGAHLVGAAHELAELGVGDLFSVVVGFEDVSRWKPDPEGVVLALNRLGAVVSKTLVVGDSAADIDAANAAGCLSCYAIWGVPANESTASKADYVVSSPTDVLSLASDDGPLAVSTTHEAPA